MQNTLCRSFPLLLLCATLFTSCRPENITCTNGTIQVRPVGFSENDFSAAKVVRYSQGSSFSTPVDSTAKVYYAPDPYSPDTASLSAYSSSDSSHPLFIIPGYDYQIILPSLGRTFSITNITQTGKTRESYQAGLIGGDKLIICYNSVTQVNVDGNVFTGTADMPGMAVEIVK